MINLEKTNAKDTVRLFAPKQITTKSETFVVQGTLLDVDDPNYCIQLRLEGKGKSLCDMIIKEFKLPNDAIIMADPNWGYGEDIMVLNDFTKGLFFGAEQLNMNYIKVTINWTDNIWEMSETTLCNKRFSRNRKRK